MMTMKMKSRLAILACKLSRNVLRILGRGATSFPGKVALKIDPSLLGHLAKDVKTIVITGTNGKTTTSRMMEKAMEEEGLSFFCNKSGANLLFGITNEFVLNSTLSGKNKKEYALIESDEAAFKAVSKYVDAKYVLVTNVFRDQLDRYGEITHTLNNIAIGIKNSPNAILCLNADCSMTASLAEEVSNPILFYGVNTPIYKKKVREDSDAPYCIKCKGEYRYDYITFGHLGSYHCDNCGYTRPIPEVGVSKVFASDGDHSEIEISIENQKYRGTINLPGGYNIYNGVATVTLGKAMNLKMDSTITALSDFECGFGRMEQFHLEGIPTRMILIKNPAGCNQVLNFLTNIEENAVFVICLNDNYADGTDISWIWDVAFEALEEISDHLEAIVVAGIRGDDMALRLKYAAIDEEKIHRVYDYDELIDEMISYGKPVYIMPTYTAMMDLRGILSKRFGYKNFWE